MIKAYLCGEQTEWDRNLRFLAAAYRATTNESTALTPNLSMLGWEVRLPAEVILGSGTNLHDEKVVRGYVNQLRNHVQHAHYGDYVNQLWNCMQCAHEVTRDHLGQ